MQAGLLSKLPKMLIFDNEDRATLTRQGLQRLLLLRGLVTVLGVFGLLAIRIWSDIRISPHLILPLMAAAVLSVALGFWRLRTAAVISEGELFGHLLVDAVILLVLLHNTGGASNPLISYLLVLLAVTATLLPAAYVYAFSMGGIVVYSYFLLLEVGAGHRMGSLGMGAPSGFELHLVGMWIIFGVSALLISVFLTRMASAIRDRELHLAQARENEMRNEQLVAIGTLAAGTAHALGTPLSTMAVLLTELDGLETEQLNRNQVKEDIAILKQQVTRCKESLGQLIRYYHENRSPVVDNISMDEFVAHIRDYITNVHPLAKVGFELACKPTTVVTSELSVRHAVINLIENGIKAASKRVSVSFRPVDKSPQHMEIAIRDDGAGIPSRVMENRGEPFISTRKDSMGLGLFLANAAVQRIGGRIEMFNLKSGGALTLIRLPLPDNNHA